MVEPITGAIVTKTARALHAEADSAGLMKRVFGPPADELGEALRRVVQYRTRNFGRIIQKADGRLHGKELTGMVNPRVGFVLLEEGSLCDDELMTEYLGGVLAASRSPNGRDDRGISWTRIVTGLSSFQIRMHYLLYREWAHRLHEAVPNVDLTYKSEMDTALMRLELDGFETALVQDTDVDPEVILRHSVFGLARTGLINDSWTYGNRDDIGLQSCSFERVLEVTPTGRGMELYGWALGMSDLLPRTFASRAFSIAVEEDGIPRLEPVELPFIDDTEEEQEEESKVSRSRQMHPSRRQLDGDGQGHETF